MEYINIIILVYEALSLSHDILENRLISVLFRLADPSHGSGFPLNPEPYFTVSFLNIDPDAYAGRVPHPNLVSLQVS